MKNSIRNWLNQAPVALFNSYAIAAAFIAYFSMYAFRKPYAVAEWSGQTFGALDLKDALIISQLLGYALSKYLSVKFCSELPRHRRAVVLVGLVLWAEFTLLLVGLLPPSLQVPALFLNGLPLGAVWGLVFSFLEGRNSSDLLGAGLSCSYIVASGSVKSVGQMFLEWGVAEHWMPAVTGLAFLAPYLLAIWFLQLLPEPTKQEQQDRSKRQSMDGSDRRRFFRNFQGGILPLVVLYFFLTALRDFRDNYAKEIWSEIGRGEEASVYAVPEFLIAVLVMLALASVNFLKTNRLAVHMVYFMMTAGSVMVGLSTAIFELGWISGTTWVTTVGLGLYLAYVPFGCILFDRIIALMGTPATALFTIYLTDAIGYTGSIIVVLYKKFGQSEASKLEYFQSFAYLTAAICVVSFLLSWAYFIHRANKNP